MHRSQLNETIAALKVRMEAQAKLDDEGALAGALLRSRLLSQGGLTTYSMLAPNPVVSIAMAARRALADVDWDASSEEVCEEGEGCCSCAPLAGPALSLILTQRGAGLSNIFRTSSCYCSRGAQGCYGPVTWST